MLALSVAGVASARTHFLDSVRLVPNWLAAIPLRLWGGVALLLALPADVGAGLPDVMVYDLVFEAGSRNLYAGTHGRSIWVAQPDNGSFGSLESGSPPKLVLPERSQVTANLTRRVDHLELELDGAAHVEMGVYDVRGCHIADLYEGRMDARNHVVDVHPENLSSGVYFVRLIVDGYQRRGIKLVVRR